MKKETKEIESREHPTTYEDLGCLIFLALVLCGLYFAGKTVYLAIYNHGVSDQRNTDSSLIEGLESNSINFEGSLDQSTTSYSLNGGQSFDTEYIENGGGGYCLDNQCLKGIYHPDPQYDCNPYPSGTGGTGGCVTK